MLEQPSLRRVGVDMSDPVDISKHFLLQQACSTDKFILFQFATWVIQLDVRMALTRSALTILLANEIKTKSSGE